MRVLLDTDAYSALKRANPAVADIVRRSEDVLLSTVVAGELLYGFRCELLSFDRHYEWVDGLAWRPLTHP